MPVSIAYEDIYRAVEEGPKADVSVWSSVTELLKSPGGPDEVRFSRDWGGNSLLHRCAAFGCTHCSQEIARWCPTLIGAFNVRKKTPVEMALNNGHRDTASMLIRVQQKRGKAQKSSGPSAMALLSDAIDSNVQSSMVGRRRGTSQSQPRRITASHIFKQVDKDGSGKISRTELSEALGKNGMTMTKEQFDKFWKSMAKQGQDEIPFLAFKSGMEKLMRQDKKAREQPAFDGDEDDDEDGSDTSKSEDENDE